jgi:NAD(P)-dependent dehydrogenase (short-subunit alcohol dehydrogenase family)
MTSQHKKRVVLVTGASSGIGLACASHLASRGFQVYGTTRREPAQVPFAMLRMDVVDEDSVRHCIEEILTREGRLDIVINNAGAGLAGPVECTSLEEAQWQFDVNFFGVLRVCRAVLPILRIQGSGYVVNIGSIGGVIAIPYQALYSASKFALEGLTEGLRYEAGPFGIKVILVEPGDHKTSFTRNRCLGEASRHDVVYRAASQAALKKMEMDEQSGPAPIRLAALIERIVNTHDPRLRYTAGPASQRAAVWLKRLVPYRAFELGMRNYYGLTDRRR